MTYEKIIAGTIAWCNRQRAKKGKAPIKNLPRGYTHDPESCPCGKATGLFVFDKVAKEGYYSPVVARLPKSVREFVSMFDHHDPYFSRYVIK